MKKVIFFIVCLVMLSGCYASNEISPRKVSHLRLSGEPKLFDFNGHEYIYFSTGYGCIVHNPDCHCTKETK